MALKDHLNKIGYFCSIIEAGSLQKASQNIKITQPQLSRSIKLLEQELGKPLLVRSSRGIQPTQEGQELYKTSKEILNQINLTEKNIVLGDNSLEGKIEVGTYDSIGTYFFPSFLKYISSTSPKLKINIETARSTSIIQYLKEGKIDVAILIEDVHRSHKDLRNDIIYSDSYGFYNSPAMDTCFQDKLIFFPSALGLNTNDTHSFCRKNDFKTSIATENMETVKSIAEEGVGVALLPHRVAKEAVLQGKLVSSKSKNTPKSFFDHHIKLCSKKNTSQKVEMFIAELKHYLVLWSHS